MADITKCTNKDCTIKESCYRHTAPDSLLWQSYSRWEGGKDCKGLLKN